MKPQNLKDLTELAKLGANSPPTPWYWHGNGGFTARNTMLLTSGFLSDVTLVVGSYHDEIRVHRLFLQMGSPVFYRIFEKYPEMNKLEIPDVDTDTFATILRYLYTGDMDVHIEEAQPVLAMAQTLELNDLVSSCIEALKGKLTNRNVLKLFQQAMNFANKDLIKTCLLHISKQARKLIDTEEFSKLTLDCVYEIMVRDDLQVHSEVQLFESIIRWGDAECKRNNLDPKRICCIGIPHLTDKLKKLLPLVRFPIMDREEFVENVLPKQILTREEEFATLIMLKSSEEERANLHEIRKDTKCKFSTKPREYYKAPVQSADRLNINREDENWATVSPWRYIATMKNKEKEETLDVEVSRKVTILGLKFDERIFNIPYFRRDKLSWELFNAKIIIKETKRENIVFTQEVKSFIPCEDKGEVKLVFERGVELLNDRKYSIQIVFSGSVIYGKIVHPENKYNLQWMTGLNDSSIQVNDEGEETEDVTFSFTRGEKRVPLSEGLISGLLFWCCTCSTPSNASGVKLYCHNAVPTVNIETVPQSIQSISPDEKIPLIKVFLDITADEEPFGKITIELRNDIVPKTAEHFRLMCTGEHGFGYKGSAFHRVIPSNLCQGGDISRRVWDKYNYTEDFLDENFKLKHTGPGLLSMVGRGSEFFITTSITSWLDTWNGKYVVFGAVVDGMDIVKKIESLGCNSGKTSKKILIADCGEI